MRLSSNPLTATRRRAAQSALCSPASEARPQRPTEAANKFGTIASRRQPAGFSLLELTVAVSLLLILSSSAFLLFSRFANRYRMQVSGSSATGTARIALNQILNEVRQAGYPSTQLIPAAAAGPVNPPTTLSCAVTPNYSFLQADPTTLKFQGSIQPPWTGRSTYSAICPPVQSANSLNGGTLLPVSTVTYSLQGTTLVRTVMDNASSLSTSSTVLQNIPAGGLTFRYYCLGPASSGTVDTVQSVCGASATITAAGGARDQKTGQSFVTTVQGAAYASNVVLSSSQPTQGCDHVCSFSTP